MCKIISVADCGFELSGRGGMNDGVGYGDGNYWERASNKAIDQFLKQSQKEREAKNDSSAVIVTAVKKRVLSVGGARG